MVAVMAPGAHPCNRLNGDYSVGLASGLWVEDGTIVGAVKDSLVAGNVHDDPKKVIAVEDRAYDAPMGRHPSLLLDDIKLHGPHLAGGRESRGAARAAPR